MLQGTMQSRIERPREGEGGGGFAGAFDRISSFFSLRADVFLAASIVV